MQNDALLFSYNVNSLGTVVISYDFDASLIVEYQSFEQVLRLLPGTKAQRSY